MIAARSFILYSLPKSRTSQALKYKKIEDAWDSIKKFLHVCTSCSAEEPSKITLTAYTAYHSDNNPDVASGFVEKLRNIFGSGETAPVAVGYPDQTSWQLAHAEFYVALDCLIKGQPWPKFTFGPVELLLTYDFKFIEVETRDELPFQENSSDMLIWLSRSNCCSMDFYFPFETPDEKFWKYIKRIEPFLPFRLEEKYFRIGKPNKKRTNHIYSKF